MNVLRILRKLSFLSPKRRIEWYPPFFFMGVKVLELPDDWSRVRIKLPLNAFSRNMGDAMFGGYQASLADPIAALACVKRFPGYSVWTRAMSIDFVREGKSDLELRFEFEETLFQKIRRELEQTGRSTPTFEYALYRSDGEICTKVTNTVAIRPAHYKSELKSKSN
ncbi:MAG: PaaI family thioesterase [Gammaproteobacteria bacterium]|nr:PaaI family thioesterase [Gammaproteobacteria bacterium]